MSDNEVLLDLQQQRLERAMGFELTNTQNVIKRSGIFDEVDSKYGIPEEERQKLESQPPGEGEDMGGGMSAPSSPPAGGGAEAEPLSENKFRKIKSFLGESDNIGDLFNLEKAQKNIYEIENKLKDILND
jgi:hypothetical protein